MDTRNRHKWPRDNPGPCLKCGKQDPFIVAASKGWFDPATDTFDTQEHERQTTDEMLSRCVNKDGLFDTLWCSL